MTEPIRLRIKNHTGGDITVAGQSLSEYVTRVALDWGAGECPRLAVTLLAKYGLDVALPASVHVHFEIAEPGLVEVQPINDSMRRFVWRPAEDNHADS